MGVSKPDFSVFSVVSARSALAAVASHQRRGGGMEDKLCDRLIAPRCGVKEGRTACESEPRFRAD